MSEHIYTQQFKETIGTIYGSRALFTPLLGKALEMGEDIDLGRKYFTIKQAPKPVALLNYSTDANTGMGTGTSKSNRFGNINENIYKSVDVEFDKPFSFNEGFDRTTVGVGLDQARADVFEAKSLQLINAINATSAKAVVDKAKVSESVDNLEALTEEKIDELFDKAFAIMKNNHVVTDLWAYVVPEVYTKIVASQKAVTSKNAQVNIGLNEIVQYKGFNVVCAPQSDLSGEEEKVAMLFAPAGIGRAFLGINVIRELDNVEDFYGILLQGLMQYGAYVNEDNGDVIMKVTTSA